ncbi:MAG: propanediol utilization protein [Proteobacteria bacterium]|nr:MAG: propanediol utilization protein [Pseudomonadota bacterium]
MIAETTARRDPTPALALLELGSIARGMVVGDATVKRAAIALWRAEAVTPGKFLVLFGGGEEEVRQSFDEGKALAGPALIDELYLPQADAQLYTALEGKLEPREVEALAIVETFSVASALLSADRALKMAEVQLIRMRLARGLGGKAFYVLSGAQHQLEASLEAGRSIIHDGMLLASELIPQPHPEFVATLWES